MQAQTKLINIFRNAPDLILRFAHLSSRRETAELADNLKRELYGMNMREQYAVEQVKSRAGQDATVREPTIAFGNKNTSSLLEKGNRIKISKQPLQLDKNGNVRVVILNKRNKYLFLRLSDYMAAIHISQ